TRSVTLHGSLTLSFFVPLCRSLYISVVISCVPAVTLNLHSFPTRRSSDLPRRDRASQRLRGLPAHERAQARSRAEGRMVERRERSEEHTSELQSRFELVCRLLSEKKNPGRNG